MELGGLEVRKRGNVSTKKDMLGLEGKRVQWDGENNVKHMWEQVKWAMVERAREVCGSLRVGGKNPKSVWWN